jgi:hypothetical protein
MESTFAAATRVGWNSAADATAFGHDDFHFSWGDHICAIFDDPDQQMTVMLPFIVQGLRAAQRCVWVAPPAGAARFRQALAGIGGDLPTLEASGQLIIIPDVEFYLQDGLFVPARTLDLGRALLEDGRREGWHAMRITGEASFLRDRPVDVDLWESYERQVTHCIAGAPLVAVCQYPRCGLPGSLIGSALRTHPILVLGESIHQSPFFEAALPEEAGRQCLS